MLTRQEIFDKVWNGMKAQGFKKSMNYTKSFPECSYRSPDGLKCAFGHIIPDELYDPMIEGVTSNAFDGDPSHERTVPDNVRHRYLTTFNVNDQNFIRDLQWAHDNSETPEEIERRFRYHAEYNSLTIPE